MANEIFIEDASIDHIDELVDMHLHNYDPAQLSMILGEDFIRLFYHLMIEDPDTKITVVKYGDRIAGVVSVFSNYGKFQELYKKKSQKNKLKFVLRNFLNLNFRKLMFVYKSVRTRNLKEVLPSEIYKFHLGNFILDKEFRKNVEVRSGFFEMLSQNVGVLLDRNPTGYWGSCLVTNKSVIKVVESLGLKRQQIVEAYPENIVVMY